MSMEIDGVYYTHADLVRLDAAAGEENARRCVAEKVESWEQLLPEKRATREWAAAQETKAAKAAKRAPKPEKEG